MKARRALAAVVLALWGGAQAACAPFAQAHYRSLRRELRQHAWQQGLQRVEHSKEAIYGRKQALLYWLDKAMLLQAAGALGESTAAFEQAKACQQALYTQRITDHAEALITGERSLPYVAEPFEQVALHLLEASNYLAANNVAEAGVELRAMGATLAQCNAQADASGSLYRDDAAGRWLAGLLREADRGELSRLSDARIDLEAALALYEQVDSASFDTPVPAALRDDLARVHAQLAASPTPASAAPVRAVVLLYDGAIARKHEAYWEAFVPPLQVLKVAYPVFGRSTAPVGALFWADAKRGTRAPVELASDFGNKARVHLAERMDSIRKQATARAVARATATGVLQVAGFARGGSAGALMELVGFGLNVAGNAVEHADVRSWQTLPARLSVGSLTLPPGDYAVEVQAPGGAPLQRFVGTALAGETLFFVVSA